MDGSKKDQLYVQFELTDFVKKVPEDEAERINTTTRYTLFGVVTDQTKLTDRKTEDVANEEIKRELEGQKEQNSRLDDRVG